MDKIKEAFYKVKQDMDILHNEVAFLKQNLKDTRQEMISICKILGKINEEIEKASLKYTKRQPETLLKPTQYTSTHKPLEQTFPTYPSTHDLPLEPLKPKNMVFSTGNQGVPTDRQTDRQTDTQHPFSLKKPFKTERITIKTEGEGSSFHSPPAASLDSIDNAAKILDSLDSIKKEIRLKFKRLTDQEILVFSTLYQLDEETGYTEYKSLAKKLNLTESSIRDYISRLIKKGIPVEKKRINNKTIHLSVSKNLKKIASLPTILQLRDL